jgi:hypothetical protein
VLKTQVLAITGGTHGTLVGLYRNLEGYSNSETSSGFIADNPDFGTYAVQNDTKESKDESLMEVFEESHASPTSNDNRDDTGKMIMLISRRLSNFRTLMGFK